MISQGILPFKIERAEEQITPRGGLALFAEVIRALGVKRKVDGHFPKSARIEALKHSRILSPSY